MTEEKINGSNGWRLSKEIPISVVGFIVIQTIGLTWFLAGQSGKLETVIADNTQDKISRYTKEDARHEREFLEQKFITSVARADENMRRITVLEGQVTELRNLVRAGAR